MSRRFRCNRGSVRKRGVTIWCLHEGIGSSEAHVVEFRKLVDRAEDYSNLLSTQVMRAKRSKGLPKCSPNEPTAEGDEWGPLEVARLIKFIRPLVNIPSEYYTAATSRNKSDKIKWSYLAEKEFKFQISNWGRTL